MLTCSLYSCTNEQRTVARRPVLARSSWNRASATRGTTPNCSVGVPVQGHTGVTQGSPAQSLVVHRARVVLSQLKRSGRHVLWATSS